MTSKVRGTTSQILQGEISRKILGDSIDARSYIASLALFDWCFHDRVPLVVPPERAKVLAEGRHRFLGDVACYVGFVG